MESVFYEFETQKNMDKVDIIRKHIGNDDFYDMNGTTLLTKILAAMDEYAQQQVKNCSIPAVSKSVCDCIIPSTDFNRTFCFKCKAPLPKND